MFGRSKLLTKTSGDVELEPLDDLAARRRRGGRGQRHPGHAGEPTLELVQREIVLAEVVTPLRDAMRLVDCDERNSLAAKQLLRLRLHEPLGRDV